MAVAVRERERTKRTKTRRRRARAGGEQRAEFSILSAQGPVLFYLAVCPDSPVQEIARSLELTERAVWGVARDLRQHNMVHLRKKGRRHFYAINLDAPLLHPTIRGLTIRPMLGKLAALTKRRRPESCE